MQQVPLPIAPRGRLTWLLFLVGASASYLLNGLGAILALIQEELRVSRAEVGVVPTLYAVGLIAVGLLGDRVVARLDRPMVLRLAIGGTAIGAWLVVAPDRGAALVGAALMGASTAFIITLAPVIVAALHPRRTIAIFGELQAANSGASVLAPFAVGLALALGIGWRPAYLVPTLLLSRPCRSWACTPRARDRSRTSPTDDAASRAASLDAVPAVDRRRALARWIHLLVAVSAEFCMVFWVASAFREWHGASDDIAAALAAMFLLGMAIVRGLSSPLTRAVPEAWRLAAAAARSPSRGSCCSGRAPGLAFSAAGFARRPGSAWGCCTRCCSRCSCRATPARRTGPARAGPLHPVSPSAARRWCSRPCPMPSGSTRHTSWCRRSWGSWPCAWRCVGRTSRGRCPGARDGRRLTFPAQRAWRPTAAGWAGPGPPASLPCGRGHRGDARSSRRAPAGALQPARSSGHGAAAGTPRGRECRLADEAR